MKKILLIFINLLPFNINFEIKRFLQDIIILTLNRNSSKNYHLKDFYCNLLSNKSGLEIAGPSYMFKTTIPIYRFIKTLDCVNVSTKTFNTPIQLNSRYRYWLHKQGNFTAANGTNLSFISDCTYDFVCSRAVLNYIGNPLLALIEWKRVIKPGGYILLTTAHYRYCYMHLMKLTSFEHLLYDYQRCTLDSDLEHFDSNIAFSNYKNSSPFSDKIYLENYINENLGKGGLTHHTFDINLLKNIFCWLDMDILDINIHLNDIVVIARKRLSYDLPSDIEYLD